jgi:hypothetical protein
MSVSTKDYNYVHRWHMICSVCSSHHSVLPSFMNNHLVCNYINTTIATSGVGTAHSSGTSVLTLGI